MLTLIRRMQELKYIWWKYLDLYMNKKTQRDISRDILLYSNQNLESI